MFLNSCNSCNSCKILDSINKTLRLKDVEINEEVKVINIAGDDDLRIKIMEMGIINGVSLKIIKKSPLNDPIVVLVKNYELTLRKNEAELILVSKLN